MDTFRLILMLISQHMSYTISWLSQRLTDCNFYSHVRSSHSTIYETDRRQETFEKNGSALREVRLPSLLWNQRCRIWTCFAPSLPTGFTNSSFHPPSPLAPSLSFLLSLTLTKWAISLVGGFYLQPGRMQTCRGLLCFGGLCTCQSICKREATSETCTTRKSFPRPHTRSKARVLIGYQSTAAQFSSNAFVWGRKDPAQHKHSATDLMCTCTHIDTQRHKWASWFAILM